MRILKKLKTSLILLLLMAGLSAGLFHFDIPLTHAEEDKTWCQEIQESVKGLKLSCGEDQITFSKFEGGFDPPDQEGYAKGLTRVTTVRSFILTFVNFALSFLGLIAVVIVIYGGFLYVTARGEQEQADKGKKSIQYAVIGILIILGSFALVNTLLTETFSEDQVQNASGTGDGTSVAGGDPNSSSGYTAAGAGGNLSLVGYSSLSSRVSASATNLISLYSLYQQIISDTDNLTSKADSFDVTAKGFNSIMDYLNNAKSILTNIEKNIPFGVQKAKAAVLSSLKQIEGTKSLLNTTKQEAEKEYNANPPDDGTTKAEYADQKVVEAWSASVKSLFLEKLTGVEDAAKADFKETITTAKKDLTDIKASISGELVEVTALIDNLLSEQLGLARLEKAVDAGETADNTMLSIVAMYDELFKALANIQFVKAVVTADVVQGNAPLVVNFNMLNSVDPSGTSIQDTQIQWDLDGNGQFKQKPQSTIAANCEEDVQKTFVSCTYLKPGNYLARVKIDSSNTSAYGSGQAAIPIKVLPPTAQIGIEVTTGEKPPTRLIEYDSTSGTILYEKNSVKFTLSEAQSGIKFDSKSTKSEDKIVSYSYDFGDGTVDIIGDNKEPIIHSYGEPGIYQVTFEVKDDKGRTNRKLFDVIVGSPVARVLVNPTTKAFLGEEVFFNGTTSSSEVGQIVSYKWSIDGIDDFESEESSFRYNFEEDGDYTVSLTVTDSLGDSDTDFVVVNVSSKPPVSKFTYEIQNPNQPATVSLFGAKSYDPDGDITDSDKYTYKWNITPDTYTELEGADESLNRVVRFEKEGEYKVSFLVQDSVPQGKLFEQTIVVDDILDVAWAPDQLVSEQLNSNGEATIDFKGISRNGVAYEIDFGNGDFVGDQIAGSGTFSQTYTYTEAGKYDVRLTVFDEDDNDKSISRKFFIGDGSKPIAAIKIFVDGSEKNDLDQIEVNRSSVITFDASEAKNTDGTGRKLSYAWDFDDTTVSTKKTSTHTYKELNNKGYYQVKLTVTDKDDQSKEDSETVKIHVTSEDPELLGLTAVPQISGGGEAVTPLKVKVEAIGAQDKDGNIVKYRWFYYPTNSSSEELGAQINESNIAFLNIGTRGKEGKEVTYRFDVEMTDNENNSILASDLLSKSELPTLSVVNGPNDLPTAKLKVDRSNLFTGESVTFTSDSKDPDGKIETYVWDLDGDGFANDKPTNKATITHVYNKKSEKGIQVRLKVIDDKFGEAVSDPVTIFVQSSTEPPRAAFKYEIIGEKEVKFQNNSGPTDGPPISKSIWDFDTASNTGDSDGDGDKTNDTDSTEREPVFEFPDYGVHKVKLTVIDEGGNENSVENFVNLPEPKGSQLPKAAFKFEILEANKVKFINNSTKQAGPQIVKHIWDFDVASNYQTADSDGDGIKDNDEDSTVFEPDFTYPAKASFQAKLTVIDAAGNSDSVINFVDLLNTDPSTVLFGTDVSNTGIIGSETTTSFSGSTDKLAAKLSSNPPASAQDNKIHLVGSTGQILFDFSASTGEIVKYSIDKNIFFDTDGNGIPNDDKDMETSIPGTWKTNFDKAWGKTVVKLTVYDKNNNSDAVLQEVVFDSSGAASIIATNPRDFFIALVVLFAFVILSLGIYRFSLK